MPKFEIFIPKSNQIPIDLKLRIQASSWIEALKQGREKVGESEDITENVLADVKEDNSIHITDAGTGRVFKIVELSEDTLPPPPAPPPPAQPKPPKPEPAKAEAPKQAPKAAPPPIGRSLSSTPESITDFLEDVFERTQEVRSKRDQKEALDFMLKLAMEKVHTDAGSVFLANINQHDLYLGTALGPKASQLTDIRIEMGQGIVGFCAEKGVGLAVSDVSKDPRFYAKISEKIGYPTRSILCAPMQMEGQVVGALELINKKKNDIFTELDLNVANFIAHQLAEYLVVRGDL